MADIDQQVARLKRRIEDAVKARAGAEHQLVVARQNMDQAAADLLSEFGVAPGEVSALAKKLEDDLQAEVGQVEKLLSQAEEKT